MYVMGSLPLLYAKQCHVKDQRYIVILARHEFNGNGQDKIRCQIIPVASSGVAKVWPGRARAQPKHHVRPAYVMQSHTKRLRVRG